MAKLYFETHQECYDEINNLQVKDRSELDVYKDLLMILKRSAKLKRTNEFRDRLRVALRDKGFKEEVTSKKTVYVLAREKSSVEYPKNAITNLFYMGDFGYFMELAVDSYAWTDAWLETQEPGITKPFKDYEKQNNDGGRE